ncbi:aldose epimerase family protein [uncultured Bacteroides sp.]|uniref:aldose epimerase family protein n=1 Tax=uncultured Bacteroides sp. TaxID=162156 RepID=UPI00262F15C3|nr:aldose epimerase family protein [uncultured Bacteroides sp.]
MNDTFYKEDNLCGLKRADFQKEIDGKKTDLYILSNDNGAEMAITNYGGAILAVMVPDRNGVLGNVVQGHDNIEGVINSPESFLSTLIGRYGNRIAKGKFTLDGKEYNLKINNGPNSLHGGPTGYHSRVWDAKQTSKQSVTLHYLSKDGEEGFPGNLDITVTYTFTNQNELILTYSAQTDKRTIVNLTHHAFFSLSGLANPTPSVENCILTINADHYTPMDENSITTGEISKVEGTPMDFRTPHTIGERINDKFQQLIFGTGYDHNYVLNKKEAGDLTFAAKCVEPISGRSLEVYTTEPGVQVYTANWNSGFAGWHGTTFPARSAICFEAQHFPDTPNKSYFPTVVLNPGENYHQVTIYKFGIDK